jgi:hypothetical protein
VGCGGGLLRAGAPVAKHVQQVFDVDDTVAVCVTRWIWCWSIYTKPCLTRATESIKQHQEVVDFDNAIIVEICHRVGCPP